MQDNFENFTQNTDNGYYNESVYSGMPQDEITLEEYREQRKIGHIAAIIGTALVIVSVLLTYYARITVRVCQIFGISRENILDFFDDAAAVSAIQVLCSTLFIAIPFIIVYKCAKIRVSDFVSFEKTEKGLALPLFFIGSAFCVFANIAGSYAEEIFEFFGYRGNGGGNEYPEGIFGFLLAVLATAVTPAIIEEFTFRGLILGKLREFGDGFAVIVTAVLFGILHRDIETVPFATMAGLVLGFAAVKTDSLRVPCAIHFFNNFISVCMSFLFKFLTVQWSNICYTFILLILLLAGIFSLIKLDSAKKIFSIKPSSTKAREKQKYLWFFTSPAVIIFIVFCGYICIKYVDWSWSL